MARRNGVVRQTVHDWLRRYAAHGLAGLADGSSKPQSCPHQMAPEVEAAILELRRVRPGWGPRTIGHHLQREGIELPDLDRAEACGEWKGIPVGEAGIAWRDALREWRGSLAQAEHAGMRERHRLACRRPRRRSAKARCGIASRSWPLPSGRD